MKIFKIMLVLSLLLIGCYDPSVKNVNDELIMESKQKVINGSPAVHEDYPAVVAIMYAGKVYPICTGTLISPNIVITAAHCLQWKNIDLLSIAYGYSDADNSDQDLVLMPVISYVIHEDSYFNPANHFEPTEKTLHDIGLILFDNSKSPISIMWRDVLPREQSDNLEPGDVLTIAGYGRHIINESGHELYEGINPIKEIWDYELLIGESYDDVEAPPSLCWGDSGSSSFLDNGNDRYIVGITSRAAPGSQTCGYGTVVTLAPMYHEWININMDELIDNMSEPCICDNPECPTCPTCTPCDDCPSKIEPYDEDITILEPSGGCNFINGTMNNSEYFIIFVLFILYFIRRRM